MFREKTIKGFNKNMFNFQRLKKRPLKGSILVASGIALVAVSITTLKIVIVGNNTSKQKDKERERIHRLRSCIRYTLLESSMTSLGVDNSVRRTTAVYPPRFAV